MYSRIHCAAGADIPAHYREVSDRREESGSYPGSISKKRIRCAAGGDIPGIRLDRHSAEREIADRCSRGNKR
jgi:hypothetical protein